MSESLPGMVVAIFGPTASGKSDVAEALARRIPAERVAADSMQVYRGLPVLSNQPETPTRLVGIWALSHEGSVGEYAERAHATIDEILAAGRTPIVVGGTGLYLRAALADLEIPPEPPPGTRERWERVYDRLGAERVHELLAARDPVAAAGVHANDRRRVVRALELSELGATLRPGDGRLWSGETRHPTAIFGLDVAKDVLEDRIRRRTRRMFERGAEEEARRALAGPISRTARHAMGLEEIAILPREQAIEALAARTIRYARYQRRWMRRVPGLVTVSADRPPDDVADEILEVARARQRVPGRRAV